MVWSHRRQARMSVRSGRVRLRKFDPRASLPEDWRACSGRAPVRLLGCAMAVRLLQSGRGTWSVDESLCVDKAVSTTLCALTED